jgi:hypothetical protein
MWNKGQILLVKHPFWGKKLIMANPTPPAIAGRQESYAFD